jgi:DNA-directed RNA polymerase specialized sigma24 family protein
VANTKAAQYGRIGYYDVEDLKQEVRIKCWRVIEKYDPSFGASMFVFLSICAERRLKDIRRSVRYKHNKPCLRCPFWDKGASISGCHDCLVYHDKMCCERFANHERYVHAKLSASQPIDIDTQRVEDEQHDAHQTRLEIIEFIESRLPHSLTEIFSKFKRENFNLKALSSRERSLLITTLKNFVDESDFY